MHPELLLLVSLQKLDHYLNLIEMELKDQANNIYEEERNIEKIKKSVTDSEEKEKEMWLKLKKSEEKLKEIEYKIKQKNEELFSGKFTNPKELFGFQKEMKILEEKKDEKETEVLTFMEKYEKIKEETKNLKKELEKSVKKIETKIERLKKENEKTKKQYQKLQEEREDIIQKLDKSYYILYEDLKRKKEVSVVPVKNNICNGCYLALPEEIISKVKAGESIVTCPNCGRILYWDESSSGGRA